eukprot:18059-Rhodomonas_salina.1
MLFDTGLMSALQIIVRLPSSFAETIADSPVYSKTVQCDSKLQLAANASTDAVLYMYFSKQRLGAPELPKQR